MRPLKSAQPLVGENPPDRGAVGLAGMGHLDHSATGAKSLSLSMQPVTAKGPTSSSHLKASHSAPFPAMGQPSQGGRPGRLLSVPGRRE
ncbi:protein of unknown function [Shinella sp. WSC3-e]|nr:protein of unknown function [Shinella sp. WSC3-e]